MRLLVCGGRDYSDVWRLTAVLDWVWIDSFGIVEVIHGGARGADSLAGEWAKRKGIPVRVFPADWKQHGRRAGPIRNQQMLDEGRPTVVVAFPGGTGTADMVRRARAAGVLVKEIAP